MKAAEKLKRIAEVIKKRFPNLTVGQTIDIAGEILDALEEEI